MNGRIHRNVPMCHVSCNMKKKVLIGIYVKKWQNEESEKVIG